MANTPYTVSFTDSLKSSIEIQPGNRDVSTSIILHGQGSIGYGQQQQSNFLHILENFALDSFPKNAIEGQLWYNSDEKHLNVCEYYGKDQIVNVDQGTKTFTVSTTIINTIDLEAGMQVRVTDSTGNDGTYTLASFAFVSGQTTFTVEESIPSNVSDGTLEVVEWSFSKLFKKKSSFTVTETQLTGIISNQPVLDMTDSYIMLSMNNQPALEMTDTYINMSLNGQTKVNISSDGIVIPATTEGVTKIELGEGRTTDGYAFIDLIGDSTYTDYGFRVIRNPGANATSDLIHSGTADFRFINLQPSRFHFSNNGNTLLTSENENTWIRKPGASNNPALRVTTPLGTYAYGTLAEFSIDDTGVSTRDKPAVSFITNLDSVQSSWSVGFHYPDPGNTRRFSIMEGRNSVNGGIEKFWVERGNDGGGFSGFDFKLGSGDQATRGDSGPSRALVKFDSSTLVINFAGDFTGGVEVQSSLTVLSDLRGDTSIYAGQFASNNFAQLSNLGALELCNAGGTPLIDFKNSATEDYDSRIIRNTTAGLDIAALSDGSIINVVIGGEVITSTREATNNINDANFRITENVSIVSTNYRLIDGYINGAEKFRIDHQGNYFSTGNVDVDGQINAGTQVRASTGVYFGSGSIVNEVDNITKIHAGRINANGTAASLPSDWPAPQKLASSQYRVNHNLNTTNYTVVCTTLIDTRGGWVVISVNSDHFIIQTKDSANNIAIDLAFGFIVVVND